MFDVDWSILGGPCKGGGLSEFKFETDEGFWILIPNIIDLDGFKQAWIWIQIFYISGIQISINILRFVFQTGWES